MALAEPFRDLLTQAAVDSDHPLDATAPGALRSVEQDHAPRDPTRPDRPKFLSDDGATGHLSPFLVDMRNHDPLAGLDAKDLAALAPLPSLEDLSELDDLDSLEAMLGTDTLSVPLPIGHLVTGDEGGEFGAVLLPTRPFDLRQLAQRSVSPRHPRAKRQHRKKAALKPDRKAKLSAVPNTFASPVLTLEPGRDRSSGDQSTGDRHDLETGPFDIALDALEPLPVAVGLTTQAWQHQHGNLKPVVIEPVSSLASVSLGSPPSPISSASISPAGMSPPRPRLSPVPLPASALKPVLSPAAQPPAAPHANAAQQASASQPAPLSPPKMLAHVGQVRVVDYSPTPSPRKPRTDGRLVTAIHPNHRQKNTAENFYLLAIQALGERDKRMAVTHLKTAAALDPTVERYKLMIRDLEPKIDGKASPQMPAGRSISSAALPLVRGRLT